LRVVVQEQEVSAAREPGRLVAGQKVVHVRLVLDDVRAADALQERAGLVGRGVVDDDDLVRRAVVIQNRLEALEGQLGPVVEDEDDARGGVLVLREFDDRLGAEEVPEGELAHRLQRLLREREVVLRRLRRGERA
jgi:hypothetical protein